MLGFKISRNRFYFRQSPLGFLTFELRFLLLRLRQEGLFLCVVRAYACVGEACLCRRDSVCFCSQSAIFPRTKTRPRRLFDSVPARLTLLHGTQTQSMSGCLVINRASSRLPLLTPGRRPISSSKLKYVVRRGGGSHFR
jgi:hypothetical protein